MSLAGWVSLEKRHSAAHADADVFGYHLKKTMNAVFMLLLFFGVCRKS